MSMTKIVVPVVVAFAGVLACSTASYAKPEYTKQTKKACATCHVDAKKAPKDLTEAGKYFKDKKTLEGFEKK